MEIIRTYAWHTHAYKSGCCWQQDSFYDAHRPQTASWAIKVRGINRISEDSFEPHRGRLLILTALRYWREGGWGWKCNAWNGISGSVFATPRDIHKSCTMKVESYPWKILPKTQTYTVLHKLYCLVPFDWRREFHWRPSASSIIPNNSITICDMGTTGIVIVRGPALSSLQNIGKIAATFWYDCRFVGKFVFKLHREDVDVELREANKVTSNINVEEKLTQN